MPVPTPRRRLRILWLFGVGSVLVLLTGLFWRALFKSETFGDRDLAYYYHAAKSLVAPLSRATGGIPVWNPFFASGQPFAANPEHEVFFPLTTLFFLLPFEVAFRLQVILPVLAAPFCMYFLLRTLRRSRLAAWFGGLAWGFGGYMLSTTNLLPYLFANATLPLSLAFVVRLLRAPRPADVAVLALCLGTECLTGEPASLCMFPLLCAAVAATAWRRRSRRGLSAVALGLALGGALGAVTLLPGWHHATKTDRAHGVPRSDAGEWSMPAVRAVELLSPHVLGRVEAGAEGERTFWGKGWYPGRQSPYYYSFYPGLLVTLLAGAAAWNRRRRLLPWLLVAGFGFLLALGEHFPLWPLLRHLPVLAAVRFPEKFSLLFVLPLVILAALGFDQVLMGGRVARRQLARVLAAGCGVAILIAAGLALGARRWSADFPWQVASGDVLRTGAVACLGLVLLASRRPAGRLGRGLLGCALLALDLLTAGRPVVHTTPIANLAAPPAAFLPLLNRPQDDLIFHAVEWHPTMGKVNAAGNPPLPAQWGLAMTLENDFDMTFRSETNQGVRAFWQVVGRQPGLAEALLERRGVTAIVQFRPGAHWENGGVVGPPGQNPLEVVFLPGPRPIAFAAAHAETVAGPSGWVAAVRRLGGRVRESLLVDAASRAEVPEEPAPADVRVRARTPASIAMEVDAKGPGDSLVAFNQTWDEGWALTIDERPAPLWRAEISLSGFAVPPGRHQVAIEYRDPWLEAGLALSAAAAIACLVLVLLGARARRLAAATAAAAG
jgi:hypothetical protein